MLVFISTLFLIFLFCLSIAENALQCVLYHKKDPKNFQRVQHSTNLHHMRSRGSHTSSTDHTPGSTWTSTNSTPTPFPLYRAFILPEPSPKPLRGLPVLGRHCNTDQADVSLGNICRMFAGDVHRARCGLCGRN